VTRGATGRLGEKEEEGDMLGWKSGRDPDGEPVNLTPPPGDVRHLDQDLLPLRGAMPRITAEFARARRYERPVTVAVFAVADAGRRPMARRGRDRPAVREGQPIGPLLPVVARSAIREIDIVCCDTETGWCIVVMPEIGREEGQQAVTRMAHLCAERLGEPVLSGLAVYPEDGWILLDLVDVAKRSIGSGHERSEGNLTPVISPAST
jgi:hypothetical protein